MGSLLLQRPLGRGSANQDLPALDAGALLHRRLDHRA